MIRCGILIYDPLSQRRLSSKGHWYGHVWVVNTKGSLFAHILQGILWLTWRQAACRWQSLLIFLDFIAYFRNVAESKTEERPGGVVLHKTMARQTPSYAGVTFPNVRMLSDSNQLNYLIDKVESLTHQIQRTDNAVDQMSTQMTVMAHRATRAEFRMIDLEARSRRNNLIFLNILKLQNEQDSKCEQALLRFLSKHLGISDQELHNTVFQRVHRLGRPRWGAAPTGEAWRPRPIIAGSSDYKRRKDTFG